MKVAAALLCLASLAACTHHHQAAPKGTGATTSTTTATTVLFSGDPQSRFCTVLSQLDDGAVTQNQTQDPTAVQAGMTRYRAQLDQLDTIAPTAIEPDVHLLDKGVGDLDDALRSVGYSWDKLSSADHALTVEDEINDPAFTTAGQHISAYKAQVCHL